MGINIIIEKCTGCKLCLKACPFDAIRIMDALRPTAGAGAPLPAARKAVIDLHKCTLCGASVDACKFKAILLDKSVEATGAPCIGHRTSTVVSM